MFDRKNGFDPVALSFLMTFGFLGLVFFYLIQISFYGGKDTKVPLPIISMQVIFGAIWAITLFIIFPIQILYYERKNRDDKQLQKATVKDFIWLFFGVARPNAKVSKWIYFPVLAVLWLLIAIIILGVIWAIIAFCVSHYMDHTI
jgi:hypothetical protein